MVYEGIILSIIKEDDDCDIIIKNLDNSLCYLEVFCIMPNFKEPTDENCIIQDVKTHTQEAVSSIRQKLLNKIRKQKQLNQKRNNYAVIEINNSLIAGDFNILSSLSNGYKISFNPKTKEKLWEGFDWTNSIFNEEETKYIKGIIYFNLGDYSSRKILINPNFKN